MSRKKRSELAKPAKELFANLGKKLSLSFSIEIMGRNENSQYNGELEYQSLILGGTGRIKIEIGIREPVLEKKKLYAKTLVKNAFSQDSLVNDFKIFGLSQNEAYAEKLRAAISRKVPAIRDIFDVEYALSKKLIVLPDIKPYFIQKFKVQNRIPNLTDERKKIFKQQLVSNLRPVLRESDYQQFDFEKAWENLTNLSKKLFDE